MNKLAAELGEWLLRSIWQLAPHAFACVYLDTTDLEGSI